MQVWASGGGTRTGTMKGEAGTSGEGNEGRGEKRSLLVVDVSAYWEAYEGDTAD